MVRLWLTNTANTRVFNVALPGARMKLAGGDSGPAVVPGKCGESRLIRYVAGLDEDYQMPPEDAGKAVVFAEAVIGACERLVLLQRTRQTEWTPESLSTELLDFFFIGFRALRQGDRWTPPGRLLDYGTPHDGLRTGNTATHD